MIIGIEDWMFWAGVACALVLAVVLFMFVTKPMMKRYF